MFQLPFWQSKTLYLTIVNDFSENERRSRLPPIRCVSEMKIIDSFFSVTIPRGATLDDFSGQFFRKIIIFCFVVAICDLVHDVETIFHISYNSIWKSFRNM